MLHCVPYTFFKEVEYVSSNPLFLKKFMLTPLNFDDSIEYIEPISTIIYCAKLLLSLNYKEQDIIALRTFGSNDALNCYKNAEYMNVYYATIHCNNLLITHPSFVEISVDLYNDYQIVLYEDDGKFLYSLSDIKSTDDEYTLRRWIRNTDDMFASANLKVKIPLFLLDNLV